MYNDFKRISKNVLLIPRDIRHFLLKSQAARLQKEQTRWLKHGLLLQKILLFEMFWLLLNENKIAFL